MINELSRNNLIQHSLLNNNTKTKNAVQENHSEKKERSEDIRKEIDALKKRDREVRAHEMAHVSAGGNIVRSGPHYDYQTGPDGKRYAIGGDVQIDTSPEDDPEKTISKADKIIKAALAPADPSAQDRKVASDAQAMKMEALKQIKVKKEEENPFYKKEFKGHLIDQKA
jgi:hypothetical protein